MSVTEITTSVTKDPATEAFVVRGNDDAPLRLTGLPPSALVALSWMKGPLLLEGELVEAPERVFHLEALADPHPPAELDEMESVSGLLQRGPYGLYLRRGERDPLRLGGPFATFLERLATERVLCRLRGAMRDGTFLVVAIELRVPLDAV